MENPLVSIFVITYNSSAYIKETLDSILTQTYPNIELIISDDCSTDNTVEICENWLKENRDKFKRTKLVVAPLNKGVAPNCNQAIREVNGEWIKGLSGDDKLLPNSIQDYVDYVSNNPECDIVFGKLHFFGKDNTHVEYVKKYYYDLFKEIQNPKDQYKRYLRRHYIPGPGLFFRKSLWVRVGGFDENYPMCEEMPFNLKFLKQTKLHYLDKEVYGYCVREGSLSNSSKPNYRNLKDLIRFNKNIKSKEQIKNGLLLYAYQDFLTFNYILQKHYGKNKAILFYYELSLKFSPLRIISFIKRKIKSFNDKIILTKLAL